MKHRSLDEVDRVVFESEDHRHVVHVEDLGSMVENDSFREPRGAARVHENHGVVLLGLVGHRRLRAVDEVVVLHVVGNVGVADQDNAPDLVGLLGSIERLLDRAGEELVGEDHLGARVADDVVEFLACQPEVEWVDDAAAKKRGVIQLEVFMAVEGHHREAVGSIDSESFAQGLGQTQRAIGMRGIGGLVFAVDDADAVGVPIGGREESTLIDEFFHLPRIPRLRPACHPTPRAMVASCHLRRLVNAPAS